MNKVFLYSITAAVGFIPSIKKKTVRLKRAEALTN